MGKIRKGNEEKKGSMGWMGKRSEGIEGEETQKKGGEMKQNK